MSLKPSDVLERAAQLIEKPGAWTQGALAKGAVEPVDPDSDFARCFCLEGAVRCAAGLPPSSPWEPYAGFVKRAARTTSAWQWNDAAGRTQAEVVTALRKASELAKAEGQ